MRAGARCWVHGLKSSPQRNGQEVALTDGLALERYPCKLASGEALRLKPVNLTPRTTCSQCGAECEKLLNCAKCGVSAYCGKACQAQHWKGGHKKVCCSAVATQVAAERKLTMCEVHLGPNKYTVSGEVADLYMKQNECVGRKDWRSLAALEEQIRSAAKKMMGKTAKDEAKLLGVMLQNLSTAFKRLGERLDAAAELDKHPLIEHAQQTFRKENSPEFLQIDCGESEPPTEQDRMIEQMNNFLINKDWQGIIGMEGRIRTLAKNPGPQNSEFLGNSLLNLSVAFRNTGRTDEADVLVNHPLVQFALDRECERNEPSAVSAEDEAFISEINHLLSRRDFAAVVRLESKILSLVSTLEKLRQDHTAGALVGNLVICLDQTGNVRGAQELAEKFGNLMQKSTFHFTHEREEEHKKVEKFLELCAAREWLQASKLKQDMLEAVVRLDTEHPEVAEQVYIFNNVYSNLMITFSQTNDYKESIALHENLLPRARKKGNKLREIVHYNTIANAYLQLGTLDKALLYFQKDYELSVENGDKVDVATTLYGMSNVYEKKGDFEKAIDVMRRGMEMHKETGDASGEAVACVNLAGILLSSLSSLQRDRKALKRNQEECWRLHTEAIATYKAGLELAETFLQSGAAENSTTSSVVKEAKVKALLELSNIEMGHLFRTQTASDFRASAHRAQEELDQIESRLRSALEFEIDHRVVLRLMASVAYARGADEEVLDLMRQCFDLHMSMSRGRLAACQYCGQLRGDHAEMLTCGSCRVSCYCCAEHQRLAWIDSVRFGASSVRTFSGHKHLCPLLKEWRLISKGQGSHAALNPAVLQYIDNVSGFKKEDKDEEGWETEEGEDEEEEEQAADDAQARPESGAATVAQEPQQREQQQRADQTQTEKQSSEQEAAEGPTREELEKKSIKELREMCKSKGLDYSSCVDKNDMVHLISSNPHATAPAGMGEAPASASAAGSGAAYEYGDVVTVIGLQSKPQHNGKVAKVLQRQKDRFQVQIQDDAMASMALRPSNLEPEFLAQGSLPFHTFVRDLDALFASLQGGASGAVEQVLTREVQALRLARVLEHASEEQARQLSRNLNALGVPVVIGTAHRHSLSGYFSAGAENSSVGNLGGATAVNVEDAVALTRILSIGMYKKMGLALMDYPPGVGQKERSLKLMEKTLALSGKVSKDLVADALLTLIGLKFVMRDYSGGLELLHRHRDTVREVTDISLRHEITSKLALICLNYAERAVEQTANGVTGIAKLILKLFRAGAELAEECGDVTTRGWCLSGQGWMTTVTGDGSDTQLLKSLEFYKEAHDILLPLNKPGHTQMRLINSLGLTANMHRDLSLRAAKAGDRGEVPQQYHAMAVQLMGQAAQLASILLSEALSSALSLASLSKEVAPSAAAERLSTTLRSYAGWYYLGRDEVVRCGQVPRLDADSYSLIGTVDSSDARLVLLQEVLARLGDLEKAITKAQQGHNARDLAKECRKLLAAYKAVGSLQCAAQEDVAEREVAQTKEMRDVLKALEG